MGYKMTHKYLIQLFEAIDRLIEKRVKPCSDESSEGSREHTTFGSVGCVVEIPEGLEARDVVIGVS